ncbi:S-methyl-5'-thioinosine phosphorylase [Aurantivibrio plasticivorans]
MSFSLEGKAFAVIGGSGFNQFPELNIHETSVIETPYGLSAPAVFGTLSGSDVVFLPRHGDGHALPPHRINYRANMWALHSVGVAAVLSVNAVGGIRSDMQPGSLVLPDQIIDYTYGREHTYFTGDEAGVEHIDFTEPFDPSWRSALIHLAERNQHELIAGGVYGCAQGPRLETAAEIKRFERDGCDLIGMTVMPEAALARELNLPYASLSVVVNWAAGLSPGAITLEAIYQQLESSIEDVKSFVEAFARSVGDSPPP